MHQQQEDDKYDRFNTRATPYERQMKDSAYSVKFNSAVVNIINGKKKFEGMPIVPEKK